MENFKEQIERKGFFVVLAAVLLLFMQRVVSAASNKLNLTTQAETPGTSTPGFIFGALPNGALAYIAIGTDLAINTAVTPPTINATPTSYNFADFVSVAASGTAITLANPPNPATSLSLFKNGQLLQSGAGNDYTVSGTAVTLAVAALATDNFQANYRF